MSISYRKRALVTVFSLLLLAISPPSALPHGDIGIALRRHPKKTETFLTGYPASAYYCSEKKKLFPVFPDYLTG